ncbi:hypothetical protein BC830DRAFT_1096585 [Chytriomyces sp. MP71]|nr:hypothetical protein BC830DRAFT_1096585 [Chytriomyces sp. MP71]
MSRLGHFLTRTTTTTTTTTTIITSGSIPVPDPALVYFPPSFPQSLRPPSSELGVVPNFLSPHNHDVLVSAAARKLKRLARGPYNEAHFDSVITGYKEASISAWNLSPNQLPINNANNNKNNNNKVNVDLESLYDSDESVNIILRNFERAVESVLASMHVPPVQKWLPPHVLELRDGNSGIGHHVDHKTAFGETIAGLCLISPAVMKFRSVEDPAAEFSVLLPPRCFYFQRGSVRYKFSHAIPLNPDEHEFKGDKVVRRQRVSIMIRDSLIAPPFFNSRNQ